MQREADFEGLLSEVTRQATIAHYLEKTQDLFYPFTQWPRWARMAILRKHKGNHERYTLFTFLALNGLHPEYAAQWIQAVDIGENNSLIKGDYDNSADAQLFFQLPQQLVEHTLGPPEMRVFDMKERRPMPYGTK